MPFSCLRGLRLRDAPPREDHAVHGAGPMGSGAASTEIGYIPVGRAPRNS